MTEWVYKLVEGPHTPVEAPGLTQGRGQEIGVDQGNCYMKRGSNMYCTTSH